LCGGCVTWFLLCEFGGGAVFLKLRLRPITFMKFKGYADSYMFTL